MTNRLGRLGSFLLLLLAACAPAERDDPLASLIARNVEARGGREALESVRTLRMSGRAIADPGQEALVTREVMPPGRIRTEFEFQGVTSVYACDGETCWYVAPRQGIFEAELMTAPDTSLAIEQTDVVGPLFDWQAKGHAVELLGTEAIDGREAYKLKVTLRGGGVQTDYLDAETALLVRRETTRHVGDRTIELETTFGDFRPVGGVMFPHSIKNHDGISLDILEVVVEEAELNVPLDEARFQMPG